MPHALEEHRRARTGVAQGRIQDPHSRRGFDANLGRSSQAVRCHRGELFRPFGHLAHRPRNRHMTYTITHRTLYEYSAPVTVSHHVARLEPRATPAQLQEHFSLTLFPEPALR